MKRRYFLKICFYQLTNGELAYHNISEGTICSGRRLEPSAFEPIRKWWPIYLNYQLSW